MAQSGAEFAEQLQYVAAGRAKSRSLAPLRGLVPFLKPYRWTILAAIEEGAPAPVLSTALYQRFSSRGQDDFARKVLSAMRFGFGGHVERPGK